MSNQLVPHRRPHAIGLQLVLAAHVQRAFRQQAGRAFGVPADDDMPPAERTFPRRIIRAEERHTCRPDMGCEVRQRTIGRDDQSMHREQWKRSGQRCSLEKLHSIADLGGEAFSQSASAIHACHGHAAAVFTELAGDVQPAVQRPAYLAMAAKSPVASGSSAGCVQTGQRQASASSRADPA